MFKINRHSNEISSLEQKSFHDLGFREREHLQEWIAKNPSCLGEDLLIIQKEFSGFSDTQERLDLLALDKQGSLVIIENKLDDTGRDVTWQALKYASYCSNLSKNNIRTIYQEYLDKYEPESSAEDKISAFFNDDDYEEISLNKSVTQRIILIAANFRKEVTSTVLWLMNFKLRLQCFKVTPYQMDQEIFLNVEQIIPVPDTEEFMIGIADKAQDEISVVTEEKHRHIVRRRFWGELFNALEKKTKLFQNVSPGRDSNINAGSGVGGVPYYFTANKKSCSAGIWIDKGEKEENERLFQQLLQYRDDIQKAFGEPKIQWNPAPERRSCCIYVKKTGNIYEQERWADMIAFMADAMMRLEQAFKVPLEELKR